MPVVNGVLPCATCHASSSLLAIGIYLFIREFTGDLSGFGFASGSSTFSGNQSEIRHMGNSSLQNINQGKVIHIYSQKRKSGLSKLPNWRPPCLLDELKASHRPLKCERTFSSSETIKKKKEKKKEKELCFFFCKENQTLCVSENPKREAFFFKKI